ncbi:DUF3558 family protein [Streptomyces sp. JNUCC 64]
MHRPAQRLTRVLVCAATATVIVGVAGCSSDSGDGAKKKEEGKPTASASSSAATKAPTVPKARYANLPDACETLTKKTRGELVPKARAGSAGSSNDASTRGTCSWSSLDNNGVAGSQFRWLNVSLLRFDSDQTRGSGSKLATEHLLKQVREAQATKDARKLTTTPVEGTGEEARLVAYDLKKKEGTFKHQTVVARVENVVVTLDYNGAGLAGEGTPSADVLASAARKAAKEAVAAVVQANGNAAEGTDGDADGDKAKTSDEDSGQGSGTGGKADGSEGSGTAPDQPKKKGE